MLSRNPEQQKSHNFSAKSLAFILLFFLGLRVKKGVVVKKVKKKSLKSHQIKSTNQKKKAGQKQVFQVVYNFS